METEHNSATGKVLMALLVGTALGAAIGVLFAPDKGSETRDRIASGARDAASDLKKKMKDEAVNIRNKAEAMVDRADRKVGELADHEGKKLML